MQKITPFLWFDANAEEATNFYVAAFEHSAIHNISRMGDGGPVMMTSFNLAGLDLMGLNGGPHYQFTPAISLFVDCETEREVDALWAKLTDGGTALMELDAYPFSNKFGWVQDRFGLSWQVSLSETPQRVTPFLMFVGDQAGHAEAALNHYAAIFENSSIDSIQRYGAAEADTEGNVKYAKFTLAGQSFMAIDSGAPHPFTFTPAQSLFITCGPQTEVDYYWDKLLVGGAPSQCGWLTDKFGVSWQVIPSILGELMRSGSPEQSGRVMQAMLKMVKLDVAALQAAYDGA